VIDPDQPGRYLLGIECDGATYHSALSARDRDRLRQQILEGLGWKIHRIWSTDWFHNPAREIERVEAAIQAARTVSATS
jgi:very-short-patch-repair endonuclease